MHPKNPGWIVGGYRCSRSLLAHANKHTKMIFLQALRLSKVGGSSLRLKMFRRKIMGSGRRGNGRRPRTTAESRRKMMILNVLELGATQSFQPRRPQNRSFYDINTYAIRMQKNLWILSCKVSLPLSTFRSLPIVRLNRITDLVLSLSSHLQISIPVLIDRECSLRDANANERSRRRVYSEDPIRVCSFRKTNQSQKRNTSTSILLTNVRLAHPNKEANTP